MRAKLILRRGFYFSETARPRPGHHEAARGQSRCVLLAAAELLGRLADDVLERAAERPEAEEADVERDLRDAAVGLAQEEHRALDAAALQVAVRSLAERRLERADEVRLRHQRDAGGRRDVE